MLSSSTPVTDPSLTELNRWLVQLVERRGSDLLLVTDAPACVRVDGQVVSIGERKLASDEIENAITPALMPHALRQYLEIRIADSSYRNTNLGRFRINLHQERGRAAATIRALPTTVPFLHELHLPPTVDRKSTRLNSSHMSISYAVFCLKKKKKNITVYR